MSVICGYSTEMIASTAVEQATVSIVDPKVVLYFSPLSMFEEVNKLLGQKYPGSVICGSTTAVSYQHDMNWDGNPEGFGLSVTAFGDGFECVAGVIDDADEMTFDDVKEIRRKLEQLSSIEDTVCFEMMNCIEKEENILEVLAEAVKNTNIRVVGGNAGNELDDFNTLLAFNGKVYSNGCVYIFIHNLNGSVKIVRGDICTGTRRRLIPTDVDIEKRIVYEFDGVPAATALSDELNLSIDKLSQELWKHPVGRQEGDNWKAVEIGGITPERGVKLGATVYGGVGLILLESTEYEKRIADFEKALAKEITDSDFCLLMICKTISLYLKNENWIHKLTKNLDSIFSQYTGFSGWGEQLGGNHLNQSMIAVAFGSEKKKK